MQVIVEVPEDLLPEIELFIKSQVTVVTTDEKIVTTQKYADVQDLVQQNFNDGLGRHFVARIVEPLVAPLEVQIEAIKVATDAKLPPNKPPVVTEEIKEKPVIEPLPIEPIVEVKK